MPDCSLLSGIPAPELQKYCPTARIHKFCEGMSLYRQGDTCNFLFCILDGQIKLTRLNNEGDEFTTGFLSCGELFGPSLANFEPTEARESAIVKDTATVWQVDVREFRDLVEHHSSLSMRVIETLCKRQCQLENRLECLAHKRIEARLAQTLQELYDSSCNKCKHGFGMHIHLSQQELADLVGASRPVISTILNKLRKKNILSYNREFLCVRDIEEIEKISEN